MPFILVKPRTHCCSQRWILVLSTTRGVLFDWWRATPIFPMDICSRTGSLIVVWRCASFEASLARRYIILWSWRNVILWSSHLLIFMILLDLSVNFHLAFHGWSFASLLVGADVWKLPWDFVEFRLPDYLVGLRLILWSPSCWPFLVRWLPIPQAIVVLHRLLILVILKVGNLLIRLILYILIFR